MEKSNAKGMVGLGKEKLKRRAVNIGGVLWERGERVFGGKRNF